MIQIERENSSPGLMEMLLLLMSIAERESRFLSKTTTSSIVIGLCANVVPCFIRQGDM